MQDSVSAIYGSSQPFLWWFQISQKVGMNNNTVLSPINEHSERQTSLISGIFYFSGQTLIKIFLKCGQVISGHYFLHELFYLAFFSLRLADTINNFEVILAAREEKYKKRFAKCF